MGKYFWQGLFTVIVVAALVGFLIDKFMTGVEKRNNQQIESTRTVVWSCTVKSNIEGVITLNDDCKITVIGEE